MRRLLKYRLSGEELLLPYYLSDHHFTPVQATLAALEPMPEHCDTQVVELFTTLNFPLSKIITLNPTAVRIPVYGWGERYDYFLNAGDFNHFHSKLVKLMQALPKLKLVLEYQLNCFSLEGLKEFIEQLTTFRHNHKHPGGVKLSFTCKTPLYLNMILLGENAEIWFKECLKEMQTEKAYNQHEITNLKKIQSEIKSRLAKNEWGKNAKK